mmetsp:Transcript_6750/g.18837  ORF Transcript_6750/g.18837 Transcript_6750/m.18837 type:complete len:248 (+) Transcript_6750:676-1419(+)
MRQATVKSLTRCSQVPLDGTGGPHARLTVGGVDPKTGPVLELVQFPGGLQTVNANANFSSRLLRGDKNCNDSRYHGRAGLGELLHQACHERNVSEAIGRSTSVEFVAFHGQVERIALPVLGDGGHHVHVAADEANSAAARRRARVLDDEVRATRGELHLFDHERPALLGRVRCQSIQHVLGNQAFLRDQLGRKVLQVAGLANEFGQEIDVPLRLDAEAEGVACVMHCRQRLLEPLKFRFRGGFLALG